MEGLIAELAALDFLTVDNVFYGDNQVWLDTWDADAGNILAIVPEHPGDANGDGWVGGDDLTTVLTYWGESGVTRQHGDLNGDNFIGGDDYTEVLTYWGTGVPPQSATTSVPEPATLGLLLLGGLVLVKRR